MLAQDHLALVKFFQALIKATIDYSLSRVTVSITFWWFLSAKEIQLKSFIGTSSRRFSQEWKTNFLLVIYLFSIRNILLEHLYRTIFKCYHPDLILYQLQCESPYPNKVEWEGGQLKYKNLYFFSILVNAYCLRYLWRTNN